MLSGLSHLQADTFGDGTGDHPRASAVWLTGVHAYDRTRPGVEVKLATTADQLIVARDRPDVADPVDRDVGGLPDAGRLRFRRLLLRQHRLVAERDDAEPHRVAPARSCSSGCSATAAAPRRARRAAQSEGSILDSVREEASRVANSLGRGDRAKLGEYLDSVREVEQRIQNAESQPVDIELPERPTDIPTASTSTRS